MADPYSMLGDIAEMVLRSGRDRVPSVPDKRSISKLRRYGLLQYQDGYSVTADVMKRAAKNWRMVARDAAKWGNPERAAELDALAEQGEAWVKKHEVTRDVEKLVIADLPFRAYHKLWEVVTGYGGMTSFSQLRKLESTPLTAKGYLAPAGPGTDTLLPTPKGIALVQEHGNPFLGLGTVSKVAARYALSAR